MILLVGTLLFTALEAREAPVRIETFVRDILIFTLILCSVFVILAFRLNSLVQNSIKNPIGEMLKIIGNVKNGDFSQRIQVLSNDEIGTLGDAGNNMIAGLAEREQIRDTFGKYVTPENTAEIAKILKDLNCSFTLDDFGTGSNPFQLLKHIPADYLKLEKSFMDNLSSSTTNQEAVKKITEQAMALNKLTIAQCVQDASSLSVLWGMGVNFIQGNFLQEPMPEMNYDFTSMM